MKVRMEVEVGELPLGFEDQPYLDSRVWNWVIEQTRKAPSNKFKLNYEDLAEIARFVEEPQ